MSEHIKQDTSRHSQAIQDDDPLAELARLVSGEDEPVAEAGERNYQTNADPDPVPVPETEMDQSIADELTDSLEMALEDGLGLELQSSLDDDLQQENHPEENTGEGEGEVVADNPAAYLQEISTEPSAQPPQEEHHADDLSFEDELASFLENDEAQNAPSETTEVQISSLETEAVELPVVEEQQFVGATAEEIEPLGFEDALAQELEDAAVDGGMTNLDTSDEEAEPSPATSQDYAVEINQRLDEELQSAEATEVIDSLGFEDALAQEMDNATVEDETANLDTRDEMTEFAPVTSDELAVEFSKRLDEDLGAEFDREFAKISLGQEDVPFASDDIDPAHDIPELASPAEPKTVVSNPPQELDFGAVFAEELGVESIPEHEDSVQEQNDWLDDHTAIGNEAFHPSQNEREAEWQPQLETDPGHVGMTSPPPQPSEKSASNSQKPVGSGKYAVAALVLALFAGSLVSGYVFLWEMRMETPKLN